MTDNLCNATNSSNNKHIDSIIRLLYDQGGLEGAAPPESLHASAVARPSETGKLMTTQASHRCLWRATIVVLG